MDLMLKKIYLSYNFGNSVDKWVVSEDIVHLLHDGSALIVKKGFPSDGSSSPWFLQWLFPRVGDFLLAAIVHDYLYRTLDYRGKSFADKEMLIISNKMNKNVFDNYLRYIAVRLFGKPKLKEWEGI